MPRFGKVLVSNRGEIARRIFRACRATGLGTVAVYSDADADAVHVAEADEARPLGPPPPRESYLRIDRLLDAARDSGADAVHPGYGFLAEDAGFAAAVGEAGLTWIGPDPDTIGIMGDKHRARELARSTGVPLLPASVRLDADGDAGLDAAAAEAGYPLLVKAVAGGGGIGMHRVDGPAELATVVDSTRSMALRAFGDGTVFLERYIPKARHIEIQVFGVGGGEAVHLYERDCSLQRRFQKVIEESPAPLLPDPVRRRMAEAAVALCRASGYRSAGTVEFIVDADTFEFFFLEMNTRIQVEHAVTEMVTGRDLVTMQIELAQRRLAPVEQAAIESRGHAIECRLYAENPAKMFMPSPGRLDVFRPPPAAADLRIETGYREGDTVTPFYDPMLAKVIAHGASRDEARARCADALRRFSIEGVRHNRDFLVACLLDPQFAAGDVSTGFIENRRESLMAASGR